MAPDVPEIAVSAAWHGQRFTGPLRTVDGRAVAVVHRGTWSNGFGPDFRDALILFDDRELRAGGVEVHVRSHAWSHHGHDGDPRYDDVVLHVVLRHDGSETRRHDGALVPVVELVGILADPVEAGRTPSHDWTRFGGESCASDLARRDPASVRSILRRLGDARLAAKAARLEARLTAAPPAEVLYQELWDGLGFSANREPMRALAGLVPLAALEAALATVPRAQAPALARGLLFGAAGFLPLSPSEAHLARLEPVEVAAAEAAWASHGGPWHPATLPPTAWTLARVRPANHPAARLASGAAIVANAVGGLLPALLAPLHEGADPVAALRRAVGADGPVLGADRAAGLVANALLPFAFALAEQSADPALADAAAAAWERLPTAEPNEATRRATRQVAGAARLGPLGARGQQGLIHLDATLCAPRRCFECPIAERVLSSEPGFSSATDDDNMEHPVRTPFAPL